jgi:hypothetical protein
VDVIGRAAEVAEAGAFVDALAAGPAALSIDGEAGRKVGTGARAARSPTSTTPTRSATT